jgi:hypothetical protein
MLKGCEIMKDNFDPSVWIYYFNLFTKRNLSRPTVLEAFGDNGAQTEEQGLPFVGISLEQDNGSPSIEIMLGGPDSAARHLTRVIANVRDVKPKRGLDGRDEALVIVNERGELSILRFEPKAKVTESKRQESSFCPSPLNVPSSITPLATANC